MRKRRPVVQIVWIRAMLRSPYHRAIGRSLAAPAGIGNHVGPICIARRGI
jgi:hypothetical protein